MNWSAMKSNWAQWRARLRMRWGRLSDDQLEVIEGRRDLLIGQLQATHGITADEADRRVAAWERGQLPPDEAKLRSAR